MNEFVKFVKVMLSLPERVRLLEAEVASLYAVLYEKTGVSHMTVAAWEEEMEAEVTDERKRCELEGVELERRAALGDKYEVGIF